MKILRRIRYLVRGKRQSDELAEEMEFHRAMKQREYEQNGASRHVARFAAQRDMGNMTMAKEDARQVWLSRHIETLGHDVRYGLRTLVQNPGFTVVAVLALGLGIGLNSVLFTVFDALVFAPWSVKDPHRVVSVYRAPGKLGREARYSGYSLPAFDYLRKNTRTFSGLAATMHAGSATLNDATMLRNGYYATGDYFSLLGAHMIAGRGFVAEEDAPKAGKPVVVLSHATWLAHFNGDAGIVGSTVKLNYSTFTVIGVTAPEFSGTSPVVSDFWIPMNAMKHLDPGLDMLDAGERSCCVEVYGRLREGVGRDEAQSELSVLLEQHRTNIKDEDRRQAYLGPPTFFSTPDRKSKVYPTFAVATGALLLILLITCANVANLLLARATSRQREMGIRLSIGASRGRIVRQLMTESILLASAGAALAVGLAYMITGPMVRYFAREPLVFTFEPNLRVLALTLSVALVACIAFGLAPALHATRTSISSSLHLGELSSRLTTSRMRSLLLGTQVALSLVLLIGAGLMARALQHARVLDPGFATDNVFVMSMDLRLHAYDEASAGAFLRELSSRLAAIPGVKSVTHASIVPLGDSRARMDGLIDGAPTPPGGRRNLFYVNNVGPTFFDTLTIPVIAGRGFRDTDRDVAVVNGAMAARYWPGGTAVGHHIKTGNRDLQVVGVVKTVRSVELGSLDEPYVYMLGGRGVDQKIMVRTENGPSSVMAVAPKVAAAVDPRVRSTVDLLSSNFRKELRSGEIGAQVAGVLGSLALALACLGVYGVVGYGVQQRFKEIGIRMALGATKRQVFSTVLRHCVRVVLIGSVIGLAGAAGLSRALVAFLYGLNPLDPVSFVAVVAVLLASALIASYLPARRAIAMDPFKALRHE